ncbi:transcription elongation factor (TFIIS) family protein [Wolffia australiana]
MEYWRKYFRSADSNIFEVIEKAIHVAVADWPQEFRARRDGLAEVLFSCQLARCGGCDRVNGEDESKAATAEETEALTEALTEETAEEGHLVREVFRIKQILSNKDFETDSVLFESLQRLQSMALSVDVLKETEIGKAVNGLRKHRSREMRLLVRALIDGWKVVVDEWVHANAIITECTPESMNNGEGQASTERFQVGDHHHHQSSGSDRSSISVMQFFDDDRGIKNPRASNGSTISEEKKPEALDRRSNLQDFFVQPVGKSNKIANAADSRSRQRQEKPAIGKSAIPEESSVRAKLEAAKRKLHERYQQAENAKKQRTIQVMEIGEIPDQSRQRPQKHMNNNWSRTSSGRN